MSVKCEVCGCDVQIDFECDYCKSQSRINKLQSKLAIAISALSWYAKEMDFGMTDTNASVFNVATKAKEALEKIK